MCWIPRREPTSVIPAVNQAYAKGLSFWQNKVIRRYAQRQLDARTDIVALAQAKAEIRALVERDFNRKSTRGRKRHARFMEDHTAATEPSGRWPLRIVKRRSPPVSGRAARRSGSRTEATAGPARCFC